jgi:hypothetical protein
MKNKTVSLLLALTLLGFNLGFVNATPASAQTAPSFSEPSYRMVSDVGIWPTEDQHKKIFRWLFLAKQYSAKINISVEKTGNRLIVTITSSDPAVTLWIRDWFKQGQGNSVIDQTASTGPAPVAYIVTTVDQGVVLSFSSRNAALVDEMYDKLQDNAV